MADKHPFSIKIATDPLDESRFRWMLCEGEQVVIRSPHSYANRHEAEEQAKRMLQKHAEEWRNK